ncbi:hypothetical protein VT84_15880 [Gemmata sp. SH-PL17]|uniref:hypothetical protein n=1 Tax=Gemmata sp. SH-PL17 TaxID=1630693 RepID=UPI00078C4D4B|nr:hypothetical protein [Gemmata sp. SH-PL17]AMV25878.1 hypothetical protein VT84_15880 [Gemmata sp. SH-PL17]
MQPSRATPKATGTPPEIVLIARAVGRAVHWASDRIALLLGDALASDRKDRQSRRENGPEDRTDRDN